MNSYQQSIKMLLQSYAGQQTDNARLELIFDDERKQYMAIWVGWQNGKRVHRCVIHIAIYHDDAVVIECNDTEDLLATELVESGIPQDRIFLGFLPPEVGRYVAPNTIAKPYMSETMPLAA